MYIQQTQVQINVDQTSGQISGYFLWICTWNCCHLYRRYLYRNWHLCT